MTRRRKNNRSRQRVAGEDPRVLLELVRRFADSLVLNEDGTGFSGHATYDREEAPPLIRALMRIEAELLLDDARRLRGADVVWRTPEQRGADALMLLVLRSAVALGHPVDPAMLKQCRSGWQSAAA
jgi:hypothetical protein